MAYNKTTWEDLPSTGSPLKAELLNKIENGIENNDKRLNGTTPMGDVVVDSIRSKNMLDYIIANQTVLNVNLQMYNSQILLNGTSNGEGYLYKDNTHTFSLQAGTYTFSSSILSGSFNRNSKDMDVYFVDSNDTILFSSDGEHNYTATQTVILNSNTNIRIEIYISGSGMEFNSLNLGFQIEKGTSASTFKPYQELNMHNLANKSVDIGILNANDYGLAGDFNLTHIFRELLGSSTGAENQSLDNFLNTGIYRCYPNTINKPDVDISGFATYGICITIKSFDWYYQIYIGNWGNPCVALRAKSGENVSWATWVAV